jgi:hypothetical protein
VLLLDAGRLLQAGDQRVSGRRRGCDGRRSRGYHVVVVVHACVVERSAGLAHAFYSPLEAAKKNSKICAVVMACSGHFDLGIK